ncbi:MAG: fused MFS/spermidine synthase [Gammaproteobacteria bacterium]|nr:fused MFS/spermidine synthase [Gammaproteobacteria bacterium]
MGAVDTPPIELVIDRAHARLLDRGSSAQSSFEVYEDERYRWLQNRDGTLHSLMDRLAPERLVLPYTTAMMAGLLFVEGARSVLMLGLGGASQARFLRHHFPEVRITAWESDAQVIDMARRHFGLDDTDGSILVVNQDVRAGIAGAGPAADLILLDLFAAEGLPAWLRKPDVYTLCRRQLSPDGVLAANLWVDRDDEFLGVMDGIQEVFEARSLVLCVPGYRNLVVLAFASRPRLDFALLHARAAALGARTDLDCAALLEAMRESNYTDANGFVF